MNQSGTPRRLSPTPKRPEIDKGQADDLLVALATVIDAERRCCPFLRFHVIAEASTGPVWLEVTGPAGTREFLERLQRPRRGGTTGAKP